MSIKYVTHNIRVARIMLALQLLSNPPWFSINFHRIIQNELSSTNERGDRRSHSPITVSAVYRPSKYTISKEDSDNFFVSFDNKFIVRGEFNAKRAQWGSRIITSGKSMFKSVKSNRLNYLNTNEPIYWPTDTSKAPDLLYYFIIKDIYIRRYTQVGSSLELFADHPSVVATIHSTVIEDRPNCSQQSYKLPSTYQCQMSLKCQKTFMQLWNA